MIGRQERERWLVDPRGGRFSFDSGSVALDLAYTGGPGRYAVFEVLHSPADLVRWLADGDLGVAVPTPDADTFDRIRDLRPVILRLATAAATGGTPADDDIRVLNGWAAAPALVPQLENGAVRWAAPTAAAAAAAVARETIALVTATDGRLRRCAADDCPLVFLDRSRTGARRWCSMQRCGNRHKVRQHRTRSGSAHPGRTADAPLTRDSPLPATVQPVPAPHWTPDEFRRQGHAAIDWIADYQERVADLPVRSSVQPGDIAAMLPTAPPPGGEPFSAMLADLDRLMPGLTHWQHPSFFAYFPANASGPAILGDLLASGLGVQGMVWATSPAATEVETRTMDWLAELLDLPERFRSTGAGGGVIQDTASSAVLTALVAALHRASDGMIRRRGFDRPYTVYCSAEAHSSVAKAVTVAGVGSDRLRRIPTTSPGGPMDVAALERALTDDVAAGARPAMIVSAVGTTGTGAVDDTVGLGTLARRFDAWLHVDAAWAGVAAVAPEFRPGLNAGLELADSYATNPHKWLLTNFDCDAFYVADRVALTTALAENPEYLRTAESDAGAVIDYRDWHIQLGRRFRAIKLWAVLRHYGPAGLATHIRDGVALAGRFAAGLRADARYTVTHESLSLICFRLTDDDETGSDTLALMQRVNDSGRAYLSHTTTGGRAVIRMAVGTPSTGEQHIDDLLALLTELR
jgi:aromatic-L-amino-acid decarboxylase